MLASATTHSFATRPHQPSFSLPPTTKVLIARDIPRPRAAILALSLFAAYVFIGSTIVVFVCWRRKAARRRLRNPTSFPISHGLTTSAPPIKGPGHALPSSHQPDTVETFRQAQSIEQQLRQSIVPQEALEIADASWIIDDEQGAHATLEQSFNAALAQPNSQGSHLVPPAFEQPEMQETATSVPNQNPVSITVHAEGPVLSSRYPVSHEGVNIPDTLRDPNNSQHWQVGRDSLVVPSEVSLDDSLLPPEYQSAWGGGISH